MEEEKEQPIENTAAEKKPKTVRVEFKTPAMIKGKNQTPEQEFEEVMQIINEGKAAKSPRVYVEHDLTDFTWQKLSKMGYKLSRRHLEKTFVNPGLHEGDLDPNRVQFEISLTEFNRSYL